MEDDLAFKSHSPSPTLNNLTTETLKTPQSIISNDISTLIPQSSIPQSSIPSIEPSIQHTTPSIPTTPSTQSTSLTPPIPPPQTHPFLLLPPTLIGIILSYLPPLQVYSLLTSLSRGVSTQTSRLVTYRTFPPPSCGSWGRNVVLQDQVFSPLLPPPPPNMSGTSRRSKRLKAQPAVVAYLKSVTGYYLALEETLAAVNSALSPPRVLTPSTFAEVKGLVESLGRMYEGHPGFRAGVDLGYRSRVFGGSTLFMIAAARCPPEGRGNQIDVWFKVRKSGGEGQGRGRERRRRNVKKKEHKTPHTTTTPPPHPHPQYFKDLQVPYHPLLWFEVHILLLLLPPPLGLLNGLRRFHRLASSRLQG
jgi:hypothetical protein